MTKAELLNILYAERNRVVKKYTRPGWTLWAIIAALASLGWAAWNLIDKGVNWNIVVLMFYAIFFIHFIYECIMVFVPSSDKIPVYIKSDVRTILGIVIGILLMVGLIVTQLVFIPCSYHPTLYWIAFAGTCILLLLFGSLAITGHNGYTNAHKRVGAVLLGSLYIPIAILVIMYLWQLGYEPLSYRLTALVYVMFYLFGLIPSGEKKTLAQIDLMINKVLYDNEEVDEKTILEELEVYIVGLRYGKYLSATKLKELKPLVSRLVCYSDGIILDLQQGNAAGVDALIKEGDRIYMNTCALYNALMRDVNSIYGEDKNSEKSLAHIIAVGKIADETMKFWNIMKMTLNKSTKYAIEYITEAYQKILGTPDMKQLIRQELVDKEDELG